MYWNEHKHRRFLQLWPWRELRLIRLAAMKNTYRIDTKPIRDPLIGKSLMALVSHKLQTYHYESC